MGYWQLIVPFNAANRMFNFNKILTIDYLATNFGFTDI